MMQAEIDPRDIERLTRTIERGVMELDEMTVDLVRQAMIMAITTAARETGPSNAPSPSKLPKKHKFRRIERYTGPGYYYRYYDRSGNKQVLFTRKELDVKAARKRGKMRNIKRLTRAVSVWDHAAHRLVQRIYTFDGARTYDTTNRIGRIPYAGLAKAGWLRALDLLPPPSDRWLQAVFGDLESGKREMAKYRYRQWVPTPTVSKVKNADTYGLIVENIVKYVSIISPNAAAVAMRKTADRMEHTIQARIDKKYKGKNL